MDSQFHPFESEGDNPEATQNDSLLDGQLLESQLIESQLLDSVKPRSLSWRWLLLGLGLCCALGTLATLAFLWLAALPPAIDCKKTSPLSPDMERLYCAQEAAQSGKVSELIAGLKLVGQWTPEHPLYTEAQRWLEDWSEAVLVIARQKIAQDDMKGAIALANQIPKSSPVYKDAQETIAGWQKQWQAGEKLYAKAQEALKQQNWDEVSQQILALSELDYDYWRTKQVKALSQQILTEKQARRTLADARQLAQLGTPDQLSAALKLSQQINPKTHTWKEAQVNVNQWSKTILQVAFQQWKTGNLDQAITFAERAALSPSLTQDAKDLVKLGQARKLAIASSTLWKTEPKHIWNLMEATAAVRQIQPKSRFYQQAQASLKSWEAQLQGVVQIQYAQFIADLGQHQSLEAAIAQAKQIPAKHPRRLQAQTLIAYWTVELERLEDRPILLYAQKLAEPNTIAAFKAAIAEARKVPMGRVLRGEAQGIIYSWTRQIQILEDQPFLNLARVQANQGDLTQAIFTADVIRPGRALYAQAQAAIANWQAEIRRLETPAQQASASTTESSESSSDYRWGDLDNEPTHTQDEIQMPDWNDAAPGISKLPKFNDLPSVITPPSVIPAPNSGRRSQPEPSPSSNSQSAGVSEVAPPALPLTSPSAFPSPTPSPTGATTPSSEPTPVSEPAPPPTESTPVVEASPAPIDTLPPAAIPMPSVPEPIPPIVAPAQ